MNNFVHDFVNFTPVTYTTWNIFTTVPTWAPSWWIWSLTGDWITRGLTRLMNQFADVSEISRRCSQIVGAYRGRVQLAELEHRGCTLGYCVWSSAPFSTCSSTSWLPWDEQAALPIYPQGFAFETVDRDKPHPASSWFSQEFGREWH